MRLASLLSLLILASCMEATFGYKNNPVNILLETHEAVQAESLKDISKLFGRLALCQWGTADGIKLLKANLPKKDKDIQPEMVLEGAKHLTRARFVGYWSYYVQTYSAQILDKKSHTLLGEATIECNFGVDGVKRDSDLNKIPKNYPEKHCKVIDFKARSFANPKITAECAVFQRN